MNSDEEEIFSWYSNKTMSFLTHFFPCNRIFFLSTRRKLLWLGKKCLSQEKNACVKKKMLASRKKAWGKKNIVLSLRKHFLGIRKHFFSLHRLQLTRLPTNVTSMDFRWMSSSHQCPLRVAGQWPIGPIISNPIQSQLVSSFIFFIRPPKIASLLTTPRLVSNS